MKFHLFHHGGGSAESTTEQDEPAALSNKEDDTLDWSSHSSTNLTVSNRPIDSDVIVEKVDGIYKEYTVFQSNLKKLLSLYKEEHLAMKTLNEKRFDTAKTLDAMFGNSPLSSAVARGSPNASDPHPRFSDSCLNTVGRDEDSKSSVDEEAIAHYLLGSNSPFQEVVKSEPSYASHGSEEETERQLAADPPALGIEERSISLQMVDQTAEPLMEPPENVEIPDTDSKNDVCTVSSASLDREIDSGDGVNVIAYDKDEEHVSAESLPLEKNDSTKHSNPEVVSDQAEAKEVTISKMNNGDAINNEEYDSDLRGGKEEAPLSDCKLYDFYFKRNARPTWQRECNGSKSIVYCESNGPMLICLYSYSFFYRNNACEKLDQEYGLNERKEEKEEREENMHIAVEPESEIIVEADNKQPNVESVLTLLHDGDTGANESDDKTEAVIHIYPKKDYFLSLSPPTQNFRQSYYDVQEANYYESAKYLEQHNNLVKYIEDWERILFQRVHVLHTEYLKHRKNLQHYIKKVKSLKKEMAKLQKSSEEKEKPVPPKKVEKLERNVQKLAGARETHDNSGESLFLFLDEVVNRSWRDLFPLLQRSVKFDQDYSTMQAKTLHRLSGTTDLLDLIGRHRSISMTSRLKSLKTLSPEAIYSGEQVTED